jgi:hypothetical protein
VRGERPAAEAVGVVANVVESAVSLPMFAKVVVRRDVSAVSVVLILQYIVGDLMKIGIFVLTRSPWSFMLGGFCQLAIDTVLFLTFLRLSCAKGGAGAAEAEPAEEA